METTSPRRQASPSRSWAGAILSRIFRVVRSPTALASSLGNRRFVFAFLTVGILSAKFTHVAMHLQALTTDQIIPWSYSFYGQDFALLLLVRLLLGEWLFSSEGRRGCIKFLGQIFTSLLIIYCGSISTMSVSFYAATGSQVRWRNAAFAGGDAASRALMMSGIMYFVFIVSAFIVSAWLLRNMIFNLFGLVIQVIAPPFARLFRRNQPRGWVDETYSDKYAEVAQDDLEDAVFEPGAGKLGGRITRPTPATRMVKAAIAFAVIFQIFCYVFRPSSTSMTFLSWTAPLLPVVEFSSSTPNLEGIAEVYRGDMNRLYKAPSALGEPIPLSWLPKGDARSGFRDWYNQSATHYRATNDPLKISNLESPLLPELKGMLSKVPIRHVMVIKLESTRKDLFPLKKDGLIWNRFTESLANKSLPDAAVERLRTLTPVANYLTGDYDDGFEHPKKNQTKRGGINFNDAYTSCTYTLKSLTSSLCGVNALMSDFNHDFEHHIYQPCLPQIFDTFNDLDAKIDGDFRTYNWSSTFMQSVTLNFDKFDKLIPELGFHKDRIIDKEYLQSSKAKFGEVHLPDVNYFGFVETPLADYMHDAFSSAKKNNERVFITHVTSTSHHPYGIPEEEPYVQLGDDLEDLSKYVNAIGYDDRWLGKVLGILDEEGVANETLVVFAGDHGISIPENDIPASYYNPSVGCNKIPLVFSHPLLPAITIEDAVTNLQLLPTVLDLLLETSSLGPTSTRAAKDLLRNYEGQSMIRPFGKTTKGNGVDTGDIDVYPDWQFTIINPGYSMIGVRDTTNKNWRVVVPVVENQEWQFSDIEKDPREQSPVKEFDFLNFIRKVELFHGADAAKWAEEASFASRWFVEENHKRWRYGKYSDKSEDDF
ncbi:hypothetical protein VHEMI06920 [[Torrubiella] hemipterigena]|uniref:Sulfatase N-terminal domain-containing protein n=1 Tax=[Torrubiella] hemipterigena TaxID=1531966 RepID=A0A0A1TKC7_9HYPO|nr:hypothetical protein VHEMI06920 [[Torrubiella] hemipterigena]